MSVVKILRRMLEQNPAPARRGQKREENPVSSRTLAIGAASLVAAGLGAYGIAQATKKKPAPKKKKEPVVVGPKRPRGAPTCDPAPFAIDGEVIIARIEVEVDAGARNVDEIAETVASDLFAKHPTSGATLVWPPGPNATDEQQCAWAFILFYIDFVFKKRGIKPGEEPEGEPVAFATHTAADPGYPWEQAGGATIHLGADGKHYPTPATFYFTEDGNLKSSFKIASAWLASGLTMAAQAGGYTEDQTDELLSFVYPTLGGKNLAQKFPGNLDSATGKRIRREARQLLATVDFNRIYLTNTPIYVHDNVNDATLMAQLMPGGLGLDKEEVHLDNRARLAEGMPAKRAISLAGQALPAPNQGHRGMFMWLPALDLAQLRAKTLQNTPNPQLMCLKWSDGSSGKEPPPAVQALGIDLSGVVVPERPKGCPPFEEGAVGVGGIAPGVQQIFVDVGGGG